MTGTPLSDEDIMLAGEAVLGLLDAPAIAAVAARIATDAAFAAEVSGWEERLAVLLAASAEMPDETLWSQLAARLRHAANANRLQSGTVMLRWWQGGAALATGIAAVLAVLLVNPPARPPAVTPPALVATLVPADGSRSAMAIAYDPQRSEMLVTPVGMPVGAKVPELWVIDGAGNAQSLGVIAASGVSRVAVAPGLRRQMTAGATLAITMEPAGGAPDGKATGAVLVSGKIESL